MAIAIANRNQKQAVDILSDAVGIALVLGVLFGVATYLACPSILEAMTGSSSDVLGPAISYVQIRSSPHPPLPLANLYRPLTFVLRPGSSLILRVGPRRNQSGVRVYLDERRAPSASWRHRCILWWPWPFQGVRHVAVRPIRMG